MGLGIRLVCWAICVNISIATMKELQKTNKLWLCLPFILVCVSDGCITLYGQSALYWSGNYHLSNESFPAFNWALQQGPTVFVLQSLLWIMVFSVLVLFLSGFISEALSLALTMGHSWGVMTWLVYHLQLNYLLCLLYFALIAIIYTYCYRQWNAHNYRSRHD